MPDGQSAKWNVKRGIMLIWALFSVIWLVTAGGIWLALWFDDVAGLGRQVAASVMPARHHARITDFSGLPRGISDADRLQMAWGFAVVIGVPMMGFVFGPGVWWAFKGFAADRPRDHLQ